MYYGRTEGYSDIIHVDSSQGYMHLIQYSFIYIYYGRTGRYSDIIHADSSQGDLLEPIFYCIGFCVIFSNSWHRCLSCIN